MLYDEQQLNIVEYSELFTNCITFTNVSMQCCTDIVEIYLIT